MTLGDQINLANGRPTGFDYLRIGLAAAVVIWHSFGLSYGIVWIDQASNALLVRLSLAFILPAFFALSGFLVAGSLERSPTLLTFIGLRVIRIVPALGVEILLSALILGPLLTALPLGEYFSDKRFFDYMANIIGFIHYSLPGVFDNNPFPSAVNGQLWTIKWELRCYIALVFLGALGFVRNGFALAFILAVGISGLLTYQSLTGYNGIGEHNDVGVPGPVLVFAFLLGVLAFRFRGSIPWRVDLFLVSLAAYVVFLALVPHGSTLIALPVVYATVFVGVCSIRPTMIVRTGDYSYGLYIYHFAIQQAIVATFPSMRHWWSLMPVTFLLAGCFACLSWFLVERPALRARYFLPLLDSGLGRLLARLGIRRSRQAA